MDSFELNKILGAILGTCLGLLTINIAAGAIFAPVKPAKPGYEIAVPEQKPGGGAAPRRAGGRHLSFVNRWHGCRTFRETAGRRSGRQSGRR